MIVEAQITINGSKEAILQDLNDIKTAVEQQ